MKVNNTICIYLFFSIIMQEDVYEANPLSGHGQVLLIDIAMQKRKLSIDPKTRAAVMGCYC